MGHSYAMATPQSPSRIFNGLEEDIYIEAKFAHEINDKMRVPKRIKATGEFSDEDLLLSNQNGIMNSWNYSNKLDMNVPDRIVVLGHDQHLETRSAPREILLENSILPKNSGFVRVQTPPRVITLNDHHFPSASEENSPNKLSHSGDYDCDDEGRPTPYTKANGHARNAHIGFIPNESNSIESDSVATTGDAGSIKRLNNYNHDTTLMNHREGTPLGDLNPQEEILYLRRQLNKLNRRVLSIEIDNVQRSQREKIVYCMGLAYFLLKAIFWLNRN